MVRRTIAVLLLLVVITVPARGQERIIIEGESLEKPKSALQYKTEFDSGPLEILTQTEDIPAPTSQDTGPVAQPLDAGKQMLAPQPRLDTQHQTAVNEFTAKQLYLFFSGTGALLLLLLS